MRETSFQSKCIAYLKEQGIYHINVHSGGWSAKGAPDLIACINGRFVAFELKVGDNDMQPDQRIHRRRILHSEGRHFTPRTMVEFEKLIERVRTYDNF